MLLACWQAGTVPGEVFEIVEWDDGLITATDAAEDGRSKLLSALRGWHRTAAEQGLEARDVPHLELLDSGQLGLAFGLESVIHAALVDGAAAQAALVRARKLVNYLEN